MLVDTHCHLNFESFRNDLQVVLERARQAGVQRIINPGIDLTSSREAVALADTYDQVFAAVGVHPNEAASWEDSTYSQLRQMAQHQKVVAIGEIGLDYYRERTSHELQKKVLREQLYLASESGLPVIIHNRQATEDLLAILAEWQLELSASDAILAQHPGVLHSFSADLPAARQVIEKNFYIGITGPVTFKNAPDLQVLVRDQSLEHLLIETDAPFLTPRPHRGERNEPAYVRFIAEKIAQIHSLPLDVVEMITTTNAGKLFNWRVNN